MTQKLNSPTEDGVFGKEISNPELVTVAVYLLGGDRRYIDTEDVAYKADSLGSGRFAWRKYRDQINLELVRVSLSDAKKPSYLEYLSGSGSQGWMLTRKGLRFARRVAKQVEGGLTSRTPRSPSERKQFASERCRLLETEAYERFKAGETHSLSKRDAENFFHVDDYVVGKVRVKKINRLITMFSQDKELSEPVRLIGDILLQWEGSRK